MTFTIEQPPMKDRPAAIRIRGRMTLGPQLLEFGKRTGDLIAARSISGIFLDLSATEDLDSAGLGELVILYTAAGQNGCRLCLVGPSPRIVRLLETTRLSGILPHFDGEEAAISWINSGS